MLKESIDDDHRYIPCRAELANPENDWETSLRRMKIKGLGSKVVSFSVRPDEVGTYLNKSKFFINGSHLRIYVCWRTEVCVSNAFICLNFYINYWLHKKVSQE